MVGTLQRPVFRSASQVLRPDLFELPDGQARGPRRADKIQQGGRTRTRGEQQSPLLKSKLPKWLYLSVIRLLYSYRRPSVRVRLGRIFQRSCAKKSYSVAVPET